MNLSRLASFIWRGSFLFSNILMSFILMRFLSESVVSIWFMLVTVQAVAFILISSTSPNIARQYSFCLSKKKKLCELNYAVKKIHMQILFLSSMVSSVLFIMYIYPYMVRIDESSTLNILAVLSFLFAILLEVYYSYQESLLNGTGNHLVVSKYQALSRYIAIFLFLSIVIATDINSKSLLIIFVFCFFVGVVTKRYFLQKECNKILMENSSDHFSGIYKVDLKRLYRLFLKSVIAVIGSVLITRSGMFILPYYSEPEVVSSYGFSYQLFEIIFNLAFYITTMLMPQWIDKFSNNKFNELWLLFIKPLVVIVISLVSLYLSIVYFSEPMFELMQLNVKLLDLNLLLVLCIVFVFQYVHSYCGLFLTIKDDIPYAWSSFIVGLIVLFYSLFLVRLHGAAGAVFAILVIQLAYNNWKWPYEVYLFFRKKV